LVPLLVIIALLLNIPVETLCLRKEEHRPALTEKGRTQMAASLDDRVKELEVELATLATDMWAAQKRLEEKGFRIDRGNKSSTGWWLTASNRNMNPGNIRVQSDGSKIVVTVEK
jgi:hypothetical protein